LAKANTNGEAYLVFFPGYRGMSNVIHHTLGSDDGISK
jgi:hypothetical protein